MLAEQGLTWWFAVLMFAITSTGTPGPNNIMIMASGLNFGIRQSIPHLVGIAVGFPAMVLMVGFGLSGVFTALPQLHGVIQVLGILYLSYLAWGIAHADDDVNVDLNEHKPRALSFTQAALFQWINPKAWVMATGAMATYTSVEADLLWQVLVISGTFFVVSWPSVGAWLYFGVLLSRYLNQRRYRRWFNYTMAGLLMASILPSIIGMISQALG